MPDQRTTLVLTVMGRDRPGLVDALAKVIAEHGGNWEEARMAHLADQFAGIVLVRVPEATVEELVASLERLDAQSTLQVTYERTKDRPMTEATGVTLELVGQDHPGIVREISHALASRKISIEELSTATKSASMSGEQQFTATARLRLPADMAVDDVRDLLEAIANDIMADVSVHSENR